MISEHCNYFDMWHVNGNIFTFRTLMQSEGDELIKLGSYITNRNSEKHYYRQFKLIQRSLCNIWCESVCVWTRITSSHFSFQLYIDCIMDYRYIHIWRKSWESWKSLYFSPHHGHHSELYLYLRNSNVYAIKLFLCFGPGSVLFTCFCARKPLQYFYCVVFMYVVCVRLVVLYSL